MPDAEVMLSKLVEMTAARSNGTGWSALCPAHEDTQPSLTFALGDGGGIVIHCHAGCETSSVVAALGMSMADLSPDPHVVAEYVYTNADGQELYRVQRWSPKAFRVVPALPTRAMRVLYQLPWISYARDTGQPVYVVEGEKDADALLMRNIAATTNVSGASAWLEHYAEQLRGCHVVVVADNDEAGRKHARTVARALENVVPSLQLVVPRYGKDMADLLEAGYPVTHVDPLALRETGRLQTFTAHEIRQAPISWAWRGWVPFGALTLLDGDPGDGKSTLTVDLVARWSSGMAMPDGQQHDGPWHCVLISTEDDPSRTIVPRLRAAGAALDHTHLMVSTEDDSAVFNIGVDMEQLAELILSTGARVVVLDPLMASMPDGVNAYVDSEVRKSLAPLVNLIRRLDCALIVVRHLNKSNLKAMYAGGGSIAFTGAARAVFLTHEHPNDPDERVLAPVKCNLALKPVSQGYRLETDPIHDVPRIRWLGPVALAAQDLLDGVAGAARAALTTDAADYLSQLLESTWMTWQEIITRGKADGYTEHTLRRARGKVLTRVVNPVLPGTTEIAQGHYWLRSDQLHIVTDLPLAHMPGYRASNKFDPDSDDAATTGDALAHEHDPDAELMARPLVCSVCGAEPSEQLRVMRFHQPWYVIRCTTHSPYTWSGPDDAV